MTKQSNKNKFLATAVTATMVATAFAPVASVAAAETTFPDVDPNVVGQSSADAVAALAEAGIIKGIDGQFKPGASITRAEASQMVAKLFDLKTGQVKNETTFEDVKDNAWYTGAINSLVEKDILKGKSEKSFEPGSDIKRSELALVLVKAYGLQDVNVDDVELPYTDVKAGSWYEKSVKILYKEGLLKGTTATTFSPDSPMKRVDFARLAVETDYAHGTKLPKPEETVELAVESVSATNAKTLTVTFTQAFEGTAADFTVNKGTVKTNIASVTMSDDKKTATIELTSKLTEGEYTVKVAQKDKDAITGSVTVGNEKVSGVEVLSDVAPVTTASNGDLNGATAAYKVTNQYGEDITKLYGTSLVKTVSGAATSATVKADGSIDFALATGAKLGDKIYLTLVDGTTGVSTTKQLTLSDKSASAKTTIGTLYNKDGKELSQDTEVSKDKFYLPITVEDQYGKTVTSAARANDELVVTNTNPAVVQFAGAANAKIKEVRIDGKDVLALEVSQVGLAGTANVLLISKTTGANTQATITVNEGVKINSLTLGTPSELVTANKNIMFPLMVTDTKGNEIKTKVELDKIKDNITPSIGSIVEVKDKGLFVQVTNGTSAGQTPVTKDKPVTVVVTTASGKVATQTVTPKAEAKATVITGLDSEVATALRAGDTTGVTIANTDLVVEDQYGQVIKDDSVLSNLKFEVAPTNSAVFSVVNASGNESTTIKPVSGTDKASEKLTFKLLNDSNAAVEASAFTKIFTIVKDSEFTSYTVADLGTVYADGSTGNVPASHQKSIVVKAKTEAGDTVTLKAGTDYTVKSSSNTTVTSNKVAAVTPASFGDDNTAKGSVTVTINATGDEFTKDITFSSVAPKVEKLTLVEDTKGSSYVAGDKSVKEVTSAEFNPTIAGAFDLDALNSLVDIVAMDQYGMATVATKTAANEYKVTFVTSGTASAAATLTFSKVTGDLTFVNNGKSDASVSEMAVGDVFNAKVNFNGVSATPLKVTVKKAYSTAGATNAAAASAVDTLITDANNRTLIEAARAAYGALTPAQKALVTKESALQTKEQGLVDAEALTASTTPFTATASTGTVTLPTVGAGYSIKVKTTSDAAKYDIDGKVQATGSSNVVFTVTHTASGKTKDTTPVVVNVTAS